MRKKFWDPHCPLNALCSLTLHLVLARYRLGIVMPTTNIMIAAISSNMPTTSTLSDDYVVDTSKWGKSQTFPNLIGLSPQINALFEPDCNKRCIDDERYKQAHSSSSKYLTRYSICLVSRETIQWSYLQPEPATESLHMVPTVRLGRGRCSYRRQFSSAFFDNMLDKAKEDSYDDGTFDHLTKDNEEYWDGERVACHSAKEPPAKNPRYLSCTKKRRSGR